MRVVIGEDEALLREGLQAVLRGAGIEVVAAEADADALLAAVARTIPDLVLTDIRMPPNNLDDGLRAALEIRTGHPGMAVMVLSQYVQRRYALELLGNDTGGVGYLLKQRIANVEQFCADLHLVAGGGTVVDPEVVDVMVARASQARDSVEQLTPRQREVLTLVAEGRSNQAIAARLNVSERAVVQHVSNIYDLLGLPTHNDDHRRVLAVLRYLAL